MSVLPYTYAFGFRTQSNELSKADMDFKSFLNTKIFIKYLTFKKSEPKD